MPSNHPDAPECPKCHRANGVSTDVTAPIVWRNGAWRWDGQPHTEFGCGDYYCTCGHHWQE